MSHTLVRVSLSDDELHYAAVAGVNRRIRALQRNRKPNQPGTSYQKQNWWQTDITGCIGELAVAKAFGVDWYDTTDDPGGFDVLHYQVRSTEREMPELIVRGRDNPDDCFILARVYKNRVLLYGWATGVEVRARGHEKYEPGTSVLMGYEVNPMEYLITPILYNSQVTPYTDE